jgi:hypothetical protein
MPAKQHRRAISLRKDMYDQVRKYAEANGVSMSSVIERAVEAIVASAAPVPAAPPTPAARKGN